MRAFHAVAGATALAVMLSFSGVTLAATGTTSGSAAGTNVKPNTSMQKMQGQKMAKYKKSNGASVGAPGTTGMKGSKSGPAQKPPK